MINEANCKHTDENTETIYLQRKVNIFRRMFKLMDSDEDGEISIFCADFSKFSEKLKKLLDPLVKPMKERGNKYNEENFVVDLERLYEVMKLVM